MAVISWWLVLLVEETEVPRENHHWKQWLGILRNECSMYTYIYMTEFTIPIEYRIYHGRRPGLNKVGQRGSRGNCPSRGLGAVGKGDPGAKPPEADAFL